MDQKSTKQFSQGIIFIILLSISNIYSQVDTIWIKTFGTSGGDYYDEGASVQQTMDDGYIITGSTEHYSPFNTDLWLIKTNASGDTLWTKIFGGSGYDYGYAVQQTTDGGYILTGVTNSFGAHDYDVWLIKTNASGDTLWTKTFGTGDYEEGLSVQQTVDGGYIIVGYTQIPDAGFGDIWLIKTNASGDTLWAKTFGGYGNGYTGQQTKDGGYIISGFIKSSFNDASDFWLIKTDAAGDTLWTKTIGGSDDDFGYSVQQTTDEGYILAGTTYSFGSGYSDVWLVKTDALGDTLWTKTFGGNSYELGYSVQQTQDGGFVITGSIYAYTSSEDVWLIKTDSSGNEIWSKAFDIGRDEQGNSVKQTKDDGYIITGYTFYYGTNDKDVLLIKTTPYVNQVEINTFNTPSEYNLAQNFPNPFNPKTTFKYSLPGPGQVTISIYSISGQIIESNTMNLNQGSYSYEFDGTRYSTGIYFYKFSTLSGFQAKRKMLLIK